MGASRDFGIGEYQEMSKKEQEGLNDINENYERMRR